MQDNDPYEILGVAKTATSVEIRAAYLKRVRKHHPDKNPGDPTASWFFRQIQRAYEQLAKGTPPRAASASGPGPGPSAARGAGDGSYGPGSSRQSGPPPGSAGSSRSSHARRPASGAPRGAHSAPGAAGSRPRPHTPPPHTASSAGGGARPSGAATGSAGDRSGARRAHASGSAPRAGSSASAGGGRPAAGGHASREPSVEDLFDEWDRQQAAGRHRPPAERRRQQRAPGRWVVLFALLCVWAWLGYVRPGPAVPASPSSRPGPAPPGTGSPPPSQPSPTAPPSPASAGDSSPTAPTAPTAPHPGSGALPPSPGSGTLVPPPGQPRDPVVVVPPVPPDAPRPVEPVHVGGRIRPPVKLVDVPASYPRLALQARMEGLVILSVVIGESGRVTAVEVIRSAPLFDDAAVAAVRQWRYTPTLLNGVPVPVRMTVTVNFSRD